MRSPGNGEADKIRICSEIFRLFSVHKNVKTVVIGEGENKPAVLLHADISGHGIPAHLIVVELPCVHRFSGLLQHTVAQRVHLAI